MSDQKDDTPTITEDELEAAAAQIVDEIMTGPVKYKPEYAVSAMTLCERGATDEELADFFDVKVRTIYRWKHKYEDFCQALKVGKDYADTRVERAFYNRCVGYTFDSEKIFCHNGKTTRVKIREHVPPDPGAALNWLKNRKPEDWTAPEDRRLKIDSDVTIIRFTAPPIGYVEPKTIEHQAAVREASVVTNGSTE